MANKKLVMLEEFEQINKKSDCGCGGNCQCNKSVNEAKKLKFKEIAKAWEFAYGEDFESEYDGIYNEIQGKYKGKITKEELQELWMSMYGEDLTVDYAGFFDNLKENLEEAAKLDEANELNEEGDYHHYIKVPKRNLKKAMSILDGTTDGNFVKMDFVENDEAIYFKFSDGYIASGQDDAYMYDAVMALQDKGIKVTDHSAELDEANPDGTISDDEDERREELEYEVYHQAEALVQYIKDNAEDIGGPFRSPGIVADCLKQVSDAFKKGKMRLR